MTPRLPLTTIPALAILLTLTSTHRAQAQQVQAVPAVFDASRIENSSHTYTLLMQGAQLGSMVISSAVDAGLISGHNELTISMQGMNQTITMDVSFHANGLRMISSSQMFDLGMMQAHTALEYNDGHVTGQGQLPGPGGITSTVIDTVIGDGVIDSGAMFMLLSTLDWSEAAAFSFASFQGANGTVAEAVATVEGSESITVPGGTFDAWRINIAGVQQPTRIWLAKDGGLILKIVPTGTPIEMVLAR